MAQRTHHTRSKGDLQPLTSSFDQDKSSSQLSSTIESDNNNIIISSQTIKTDVDALSEHLPPTQIDNPSLAEIKDCLQRHEVTIDKLITLLARLSTTNNTTLSIDPVTSSSESSTVSSQICTTSTIDQATKQLRSKQIAQLFESTPFSGSRTQDVVDWLDEFNRKCDDIKLDDTQRLSIARGLMTSDAKLWVDTLRNMLIDWKSFQSKLITYFQLASGIDCFSFSEQLYTRQQQLHESAIQYYHDMMRLCSKVDINMDNNTRLKHLYRGLRRETKITIDIQKFNNPDDFLQELVRFEQLQKEFDTEASETIMTYQSNTSYMPNESVHSLNNGPYQQHNQQQPYQQHNQQQPYQQQHQQPAQQYQQQQQRDRKSNNSYIPSRPRHQKFPSHPSRSSSQYRNHQSSSKYDNRHLNES